MISGYFNEKPVKTYFGGKENSIQVHLVPRNYITSHIRLASS